MLSRSVQPMGGTPYVSLEPRHENKTCSACRERVNERVKVVKVAKVVKVKECESDF